MQTVYDVSKQAICRVFDAILQSGEEWPKVQSIGFPRRTPFWIYIGPWFSNSVPNLKISKQNFDDLW